MKPLQADRAAKHGLRLTVAVAAVTLTALVSCATPAPNQPPSMLGSRAVSPEMLVNAAPLVSGTLPKVVSSDEILELSPEMKRFVDDHIRDRRGSSEKLRLLIFAVMGEGTFRLIYDETTRTAAQTFDYRRGNCRSFTNMFIAMARYVGLEAEYQEVDVPPDWAQSGQFLLLNKHVNVVVDVHDGHRIIDFNMYDPRMDYGTWAISDERARAHFYNNLGVEQMLDANTPQALSHFVEALGEDDSFAPAWINLGILYRREGHPAYAEAALLEALQIEPENLVAMSNLANLYEEQGLQESAARYRERVQSHRMRNPYYRYSLANEAFADGDYRASIAHLKYALRHQEYDPRFYSLMSMNYLMMGDRDESTKWMKKAEEVAMDREEREWYGNKLNLLLQESSR
jgi:Flp pilus assembly protein TadD